MTTTELYLRYTDQAGRSSIRMHWVWNAEKFHQSQIDSSAKEKPPVTVTLATKADYLESRKR